MTERGPDLESEATSPIEKLKSFVDGYRAQVIAKYSIDEKSFLLNRKRSPDEVGKMLAKEIAVGSLVTAGSIAVLIGAGWLTSSKELVSALEAALIVIPSVSALGGMALTASTMVNAYVMDRHLKQRNKQ